MKFLAKLSYSACDDCGATAPGLESELVHRPDCPFMMALDKVAKASNFQAWERGDPPAWPWQLTDEQREALRVLDHAIQFLVEAERLPRNAQVWVHGRLQDASLQTQDAHAKAVLEAMRQYLSSYLYQRKW